MITEQKILDLSKKNYVRKASHFRNYWFDFSKGKLDQYLLNGEKFNIVIYSGLEDAEKYYIIPFEHLKAAFKPEYMTRDKKNRKPWVGTIIDHKLKISNFPDQMDVAPYFSSLKNADLNKQDSLPTVPKLVTTWYEVIDNFREFSIIKDKEPSFAFTNFSVFSNWYYFPFDDTFAPGKFIGYKNSTILKYSGLGDGADAKRALNKFFKPISKESSEFRSLLEKLDLFAAGLDKKINPQTNSGSAGIFIPKEPYINHIPSYTNKVFDISRSDIDSFLSENNFGFEGDKKERLVSYYERDPKLRSRAIKIHGTKCQVCKFDFKKNYGTHGENYIEVHHKNPLHTLIEASEINPKTDMAVLCANCHRMIHRKKYEPLSIENLINLWNKLHT